MRGKNLRTGRLVRAMFGFEGTLAAKSIKRSRRSYRAMVAALAMSIILYLVCASLDTQFTQTMNQAYNNINCNTFITIGASRGGLWSERKALDPAKTKQATDTLLAYPDTMLYGVGVDTRYTTDAADPDLTDKMLQTLEPEQTSVTVALATPDRAHYEALCALAGVPAGSNILLNSANRVIGSTSTEFQPLRFHNQTLLLDNGDTQISLPLHAQLIGAQVPQEVVFTADEALIVVVPDCEARLYAWFGLSADIPGFIALAENTLETLFLSAGNQDTLDYNVTDVSAMTEMTRSLTRLITVFLFGFVGMLSLIGLTSVISAISANVRLRAREFAVLTSVGMTQGGVRRMLALESVMSALKALLWGLPLGAAGTYLAYLALTRNVHFGFVFPWHTIPEVVLGVFVITLITTQYAAAKLRSGSVMEAIRANEGI